MSKTQSVNIKKVKIIAPKKNTGTILSRKFDLLFDTLSERETKIITMRFGINQDKHTLEAIGQKFGITRERVRQLENAIFYKLSKDNNISDLLPIHTHALSILKKNGGFLEKSSMLNTIFNAIKSKNESDIRFIEITLRLFNDIRIFNNTIKLHPYYILASRESNSIKYIESKVSKKLAKKMSTMTLNEIQKLIAPASYNLSLSAIYNICKICKTFKITKEDTIGLFSWTNINPRNIHDKIIYTMEEVKKPLHFETITNLIIEQQFDSKNINVQAVHNELIRHDDFILIGRGIYALKTWGYTSGTVSDVITEILKTSKKPMRKDEIIERVLKVRQVKSITIQLNLKNKALFERVGRNTYALKK